MMFKKILLISAALAALSSPAAAQSGCPSIVNGAVLTAGQWNACFQLKNNVLGYVPVNKGGDTMTGPLGTVASTTLKSGLIIPPGSAPTSPINGDVWTTAAGMYVRIAGTTIGPLAGATSSSFAATSPLLVSYPAGVVTYAFDFSIANTFLAQQTNQGTTTTAPGWYAQIAGDTVPRVRVGMNATDVASIAFGPGNAVRDTFIERAAAASIRFGAPDAATAIAQTIGVQNVIAGTSNTAGADVTFAGSRSTGSATGGGYIFQTSPLGSAGTSQNALVTALRIYGTGGITVGATPTSGDQGPGKINVSGGYYVNGALISPTGAGLAGQMLNGVTSSAPIWTYAPTLGASGTAGSLSFGNATSGIVTIQPITGALGTVTALLPANSGVIAELNYAQSWTATQTFQTILAGTTNTYDIGTNATTAAFRTIYAGTSFIGPTGQFTTAAASPILRPITDGTTALQVTKADGTTRIMDFDTTNARVGINKTPGAFDLDVAGAVNFASTGAIATSLTIGGASIGSNALAITGSAAISSTLASAAHTITSASATSLAIGLNGSTNPAFLVDSSTALSATGIKIKSAAATGGVAISVITSGTNENMAIDAAGSGTVMIGGTSTGAITLNRATTIGAALTYGGVTLSNSVSGTGSMLLSSNSTAAGFTVTGSFTATGLVTNADLANPATTVNGQTCTLGSPCTIVAAASSITAGTTVVNGGPGVLQNASSGGTLVSSTSLPSGLSATNMALTTPAIGVATGTSLALGGCTISTNALCVTGTANISGATTISGALTYGGVTLSNAVTGTGNLVAASAATMASLTVNTAFTATGLVTNASLANANAYTFKGNVTGSPAAPTDFTMASLPLKASPAAGDLVIIADSASSNATKYTTVSALASAGSVASFNSLTGAVTTSVIIQSFCPSGCTTTVAGGGTATYTPTSGMLHAVGVCFGGGAGGGGAAASPTGLSNGGGGGAGSKSIKLMTAASVGASKTVTVGAGGTAGSAGNNSGGSGGDSSIGTLVVGKGGSPGSGAATNGQGTGGTGGIAGTGDVVGTGQSGQAGAGASITTIAIPFSSGGSTELAGGGGSNNGTGQAGGQFGGGGSGGTSFGSASTFAGGAGGDGGCIVYEYINL